MIASYVPDSEIINLPTFITQTHTRSLELVKELSVPYQHHSEFPRFVKLVASYLGEGKTLRALGVAVGAFLAGETKFAFSATTRDLGAAMEFYQASALVHDDLIDDVPLRRNHATIQVAAADFLPPDAANAAAVLVGDFLLSLNHAVTALAVENTVASISNQIHQYMAQITAEVAWGQYLDILTESFSLTNPLALRKHVLEVITVKSGRYSVMHPLILGAISQGGTAALKQALETAGTAWGIAFQMRDDELGLYGETSVTGKPISSDLAEGKRTILLSLALERVDSNQRDTLLSALGNKKINDTQIQQVREIIRECGALDAHEEMLQDYVQRGFHAFKDIKMEKKHQQVITEFVNLLVNRRY